MSRAGTTCAAAVFAGLALAACKPVDATSGDVVVTTSMSRSGTVETHYAECAGTTAAATGEYQVEIPADLDYGGLPTGSPCPTGPAEPMPADAHPELYTDLDRALNAPMPYEGGNEDTCGAWAAQDPADARQMLAECPPLTKGDLP